MASLKELRRRIDNVKNMRRITSAMKMVAASKLRHAQDRHQWAQPYYRSLEQIFSELAEKIHEQRIENSLMTERREKFAEKKSVTLYILVSSDRGLCGAFNANVMRHLRQAAEAHREQQTAFKLITIGRKATALVTLYYNEFLVYAYPELAHPAPEYESIENLAIRITAMFEAEDCDRAVLVYNQFVNTLHQEIREECLIPLRPQALPDHHPNGAQGGTQGEADEQKNQTSHATDENGFRRAVSVEPSPNETLEDILPCVLSMRLFRSVLESFRSEQASRMNAMDNATRNAGDMISELTLNYNRLRQAAITRELIEIISGAEAV